MNVIDFECDTPTREAVEDTIRLIHSGRGFDKEGYAQLMAPGWAAQIGMTLEEFNRAKAEVGLTALALEALREGHGAGDEPRPDHRHAR